MSNTPEPDPVAATAGEEDHSDITEFVGDEADAPESPKDAG